MMPTISDDAINQAIADMWPMFSERFYHTMLLPRIDKVVSADSFAEKQERFTELAGWIDEIRENQRLADLDAVIDYTLFSDGQIVGTQNVSVCPACGRNGVVRHHTTIDDMYWCRGSVVHVLKPTGALLSTVLDSCDLPGAVPDGLIDWNDTSIDEVMQ